MSLGQGKYGNGRGHDPRCNCPDCQSCFLSHNRTVYCDCMHCVHHREIGAAQPRLVPRIPYEAPKTQPTVNNAKRGKRMAGVNICERPGCNALVRGQALSYVDIMPNTTEEGKRVIIELCPACMRETWEQVHSTVTTPRERGYSEPFVPGKTDDDVDRASDEQLLAELLTRLAKRGNKELTGTLVDNGDGK